MVILIDKENNKPSDFFFFIQGMGVILSSYLSSDKWFSNNNKNNKSLKRSYVLTYFQRQRE